MSKQRGHLGEESHSRKHRSSKGLVWASSKTTQRSFRNQAEDDTIIIWEFCAWALKLRFKGKSLVLEEVLGTARELGSEQRIRGAWERGQGALRGGP